MSHTVTITVKIRDKQALSEACRRVGADCKLDSEMVLNGVAYKGHVVKLKGWTKPVCFTASGEVVYDNWGGRWGEEAELNKLKQAYSVGAAKRVAQRQGKRVVEQRLANGSVQLRIS